MNETDIDIVENFFDHFSNKTIDVNGRDVPRRLLVTYRNALKYFNFAPKTDSVEEDMALLMEHLERYRNEIISDVDYDDMISTIETIEDYWDENQTNKKRKN